MHEAKYEFRFCNGAQKAELGRLYRSALESVAAEFGVTCAEIEAAVAKDFGDWMKQERLPKLSPPPEQK